MWQWTSRPVRMGRSYQRLGRPSTLSSSQCRSRQRQNGRLYYNVHEGTKPHLVDLNRKSTVSGWLHLHQNEWYVRMAHGFYVRHATEASLQRPQEASQPFGEHANVNRRLRAYGPFTAEVWKLPIGPVLQRFLCGGKASVELAQYALEPTPALAGRLGNWR